MKNILLCATVFGTSLPCFAAPVSLPNLPMEMGAGISTQYENGLLKSADGPEGCLVGVTGTELTILTVPGDFSPFVNSIDVRDADVSSPEKGIVTYSITPKENLCLSPFPGQTGTMQSGGQILYIESNAKAPVVSLVTKIACFISGQTVEKTFKRKCNFNFVAAP